MVQFLNPVIICKQQNTFIQYLVGYLFIQILYLKDNNMGFDKISGLYDVTAHVNTCMRRVWVVSLPINCLHFQFI